MTNNATWVLQKLTATDLARLDRRVPRYTSYPTALEFRSDFSDQAYQQALESINDASDVGVYVHLPFCKSLCYYCGCSMAVRKSSLDAAPYLRHLTKEIQMVSQHMADKPNLLELHLGGGTPTFLSDIQLQQLIETLRDRFLFDPNAELAIELDPRSLVPERVVMLRCLGFNRFSLGVQDFDPAVQAAIHRIQPVALVRELVSALRANQASGINFDLIYGLPLQNKTTWERTLSQVVELDPDRIALYNFAYLPTLKPHQKKLPQQHLPQAADKLALYIQAVETLTGAGYVHLGMDHFVKPSDSLYLAQINGYMQRNFQGYAVKRSNQQIGFGVTAIGKVGNVYIQNARTLPAYQAALDANRLPLEKGLALSQDDLARAAVIQRLMCNFELDFEEFAADTGLDARQLFAAELATLAANEPDLVTVDTKGIRSTQLGRHFIRNVAAHFDRYRNGENSKTFSRSL